jgi:hypothetical protein
LRYRSRDDLSLSLRPYPWIQAKVRATVKIGSTHFLTVDLSWTALRRYYRPALEPRSRSRDSEERHDINFTLSGNDIVSRCDRIADDQYRRGF